MVRQRFVEIVALPVPADMQTLGSDLHKEAFRAQVLEKEDESELKENYRVDARTAWSDVELLDQIPHEQEVEGTFSRRR